MPGKDPLDRLSDIVVREFVRNRRIHSCLPLALIFHDEAKKLGYVPQLVKGFNLRKEGKGGCRHYWVEVEGRVFDLTTRVYQQLTENYHPPERDTEFPEGYTLLDQGLIGRLTETHFNLVLATGTTELYFQRAPPELLAIRSNISRLSTKLRKSVLS